MKKSLLVYLPCLSLLLSCSASNPRKSELSESSIEESPSWSVSEPEGTYHVFDASALPETPIEEERNITIDGFDFAYYNVYKDGEDGFVLKNEDSYIRNTTIAFGLLFHSDFAAAYKLDDGDEKAEEHELRYEKEGYRSYSIFPRGFEIAIDRSLSRHYEDVSIGKIEHWC